MNLEMDKAEIRKITKKCEEKYSGLIIQISMVCGDFIHQEDWIGLMWFIDALKQITITALQKSGVDVSGVTKQSREPVH